MPITLVTGGASSGKSSFALSMIDKNIKTVFIATGVPTDDEMREKIEIHQSERPVTWKTIEEPTNLVSLFKDLHHETNNSTIIIDCLTFWVSNLMFYKNYSRKEIINEANILAGILSQYTIQIILVTNELGMGIIPADRESRIFRRIAGEVNQIFAKNSNKVYFVVSGIGIKIKEVN